MCDYSIRVNAILEYIKSASSHDTPSDVSFASLYSSNRWLPHAFSKFLKWYTDPDRHEVTFFNNKRFRKQGMH